MDALRLLLVFSSFAGLSFSFVEKRSVLSGSRDDKEQGHRLGIGMGLGLFALLVVVFTAYLGIRRINSRDEAPTAKPTLWRRRRERRIRRHLNNRLKREQESRSTTTDGDEQTRHLASRYANPKNYIKRRTNKKEAKVVQFFRHHRMKRCARRAAARERARVRLHSRAHDRKLRALGKKSKPSYNVPCQPVEDDDTRPDVDGQRRLKSKFASEKYFPHETPVEYWKEKLPVPPKRKSKEHARLKSKEIVVQEEKPESKTKLFIPHQKKLNSLAKKMQPDAEDKALIEDKNGVDFNWPISVEMMYEQLPETDFSKVNKLEEMITGWAEAGVFNLEEQVREKRSMGPLWDHAAMTPQKATTSPNRVRLNPSKWLHEDDWINASYLGPPEDSQRFICSPAPDKSWEYEYWTMLVDHNVRCVVQLNNWDYHTPVMDQKQFFIPFEKQHYVSSQSKTSHMSNEKNNSGGEKNPKVKSAESTVSQIDECIKLRKEYKLGRGRKKDGRNPRRRLSVKRKPVDDPSPKGGKTKKKKGKGRQNGGRDVSKIIKTSTEKSDSKSTTDPRSINKMTKPTSTETRPTSKETLTNKETKSTNKDTKSTNRETNTPSAKQDNESRSIYSKDKDMPTSPPVAPATPAERRKARKLRRKLRRGMRRIREDGGIPEILIRKLSVCYLFPEPATQDENSDVQFSVKPCRHPNSVNYWRIVNGNNADEDFWVRATLLRVVCRQKDVNYKMVHFQVFNLDPYQPPDFTRYKCLINLVNKIAGTVSVVSEHGLSRAPTFCLSAILLQQLKADQLPDLLKLYSQMQLDRPGCFFRPHGFFIALRTMLEHVKQYQKHFKQKDSLEKLLTEIKLTFCLKRF